MLAMQDAVVEKFHNHLAAQDMRSELLPYGSMDFEYDFPRISLAGPREGTACRGALRLIDEPIDYIDILKRKVLQPSAFLAASMYGMGIGEYTTWKVRFFLSLPKKIRLGPFKIGTLSKVLRGTFRSKVEDYMWNGYGKLTTLPPGTAHDDVIAVLDADKKLRQLMMDTLLKERTITVSAYRPKKDKTQTGANESLAKVVISSEWRPQSDLFINKKAIDVYRKISEDVKKTIMNLRYVLENY